MAQFNREEVRRSLARAVFHGRRGGLRQRYRKDQKVNSVHCAPSPESGQRPRANSGHSLSRFSVRCSPPLLTLAGIGSLHPPNETWARLRTCRREVNQGIDNFGTSARRRIGRSLPFEKKTLLTQMPRHPEVFAWIVQDRPRPEPTPSRRQDSRIWSALFCGAQPWNVRGHFVSITR
jgi:hypothetical protein